MQVDELLEILNYKDSPNYLATDCPRPNPHVGISGNSDDAQYLRSLTIFLNSSIIK
ncbi:MAG: hypothetical protein J7647_18245 [Cyanobacteria bacterium SBLK]|nr:hypothetical protein [Cyanobacteria bacterium SBLK]